MSNTCDLHEGDLSYPCSPAPRAEENKSEVRRSECGMRLSTSAMEAERRNAGFQGSQEIRKTAPRASSLINADKMKEKLSDGLKDKTVKTAYSSTNLQKRPSENLDHVKEWIESACCNSISIHKTPLSSDNSSSTAPSITMSSSSISASSIESSTDNSSSVASSLSRASASIRSAGATLRTLQIQLNLLTQESHHDHFFHQTAAEMMGTHAVELNHLQQMERDAIQQAEDELRREVIAALTANQKTLKETRENNEYEERLIREQIESWRTQHRDVKQESTHQNNKKKTKRRSKEREEEMLASIRLSTPQEPLYQNTMRIVQKEKSNDARDEKRGSKILPERQDDTFSNSKLPKEGTEQQVYHSSKEPTPLLFPVHSVKILLKKQEEEEIGQNTLDKKIDKGNGEKKSNKVEEEKTGPSAINQSPLRHADNSACPLETRKEHVVHSGSTIFLCGSYVPCSVSAVCPHHIHVCGRCCGGLQDASGKHVKMASMVPSPSTCLDVVPPKTGGAEIACCTCIPRGTCCPFHCSSSSFSCHACCCRCWCSSSQHNVSRSEAFCAHGEGLKHVEKSSVEEKASSETHPHAAASDHPTVRFNCSEDAVGGSVHLFPPPPCDSECVTREAASDRDHTDVHIPMQKQKEQKHWKKLKKRERECTSLMSAPPVLRASSSPSLDHEAERVEKPKKSNRKSSRPKRRKETLSFFPSRRLPPFLPCGPHPRSSPEKSTSSCFPLKNCDFSEEDMNYLNCSGEDGAPPPPPPLPTSSSFPALTLYSHHVDGVRSAAQHFNQLRPREYYHRLSRVDGRIPVGITDTTFSKCRVRKVQKEKAACGMGETEQEKLYRDGKRFKRLSKKLLVNPEETRPSSKRTSLFRGGRVGKEKEAQRHYLCGTPESYGRSPRRFLTASDVAGHPSPPHHWNNRPRHASVGRLQHTTFSSAERKRAVSLQHVMKAVHREKLYCDALFCYLQQVIHPRVLTSWYSV